jgi:hypothetical protein
VKNGAALTNGHAGMTFDISLLVSRVAHIRYVHLISRQLARDYGLMAVVAARSSNRLCGVLSVYADHDP